MDDELPIDGDVQSLRDDPEALRRFQEWFREQPFRAVRIWLDLQDGLSSKDWRSVGFSESELTQSVPPWVSRIREGFPAEPGKASWQLMFVSRALAGQALLRDDGRAGRYLLGERGRASIPDAKRLLRTIAQACDEGGFLLGGADIESIASTCCTELALTPEVAATRLLQYWTGDDREQVRDLHRAALSAIAQKQFDALDQCIHGLLLHHERVRQRAEELRALSGDGAEPGGIEDALRAGMEGFLRHLEEALAVDPDACGWDQARSLLESNAEVATRLIELHNQVVPDRNRVSLEDIERDRVRAGLANSGDAWLVALVDAMASGDRQLRGRARGLVDAFERGAGRSSRALRGQVMDSFRAHHRELWADIASAELLGGSASRRLESALVGVMVIHALAEGRCEGTLASFEPGSTLRPWLPEVVAAYRSQVPGASWPPLSERHAANILNHLARAHAIVAWQADLGALGVPIRGGLKEAFDLLEKEYCRLLAGSIAVAPPYEWAADFFRAAFEKVMHSRGLSEREARRPLLEQVLDQLGLTEADHECLESLWGGSQALSDLERVVQGADDPPVPNEAGVAPALNDILSRAIQSDGRETASEQRKLRLCMALHWVIARSDSAARMAESACWDDCTVPQAAQAMEVKLRPAGQPPSRLDEPLLRMGKERIRAALGRLHDHPAPHGDEEVRAVAKLEVTAFTNLIIDWLALLPVPTGGGFQGKILRDHGFALAAWGTALVGSTCFLLWSLFARSVS